MSGEAATRLMLQMSVESSSEEDALLAATSITALTVSRLSEATGLRVLFISAPVQVWTSQGGPSAPPIGYAQQALSGDGEEVTSDEPSWLWLAIAAPVGVVALIFIIRRTLFHRSAAYKVRDRRPSRDDEVEESAAAGQSPAVASPDAVHITWRVVDRAAEARDVEAASHVTMEPASGMMEAASEAEDATDLEAAASIPSSSSKPLISTGQAATSDTTSGGTGDFALPVCAGVETTHPTPVTTTTLVPEARPPSEALTTLERPSVALQPALHASPASLPVQSPAAHRTLFSQLGAAPMPATAAAPSAEPQATSVEATVAAETELEEAVATEASEGAEIVEKEAAAEEDNGGWREVEEPRVEMAATKLQAVMRGRTAVAEARKSMLKAAAARAVVAPSGPGSPIPAGGALSGGGGTSSVGGTPTRRCQLRVATSEGTAVAGRVSTYLAAATRAEPSTPDASASFAPPTNPPPRPASSTPSAPPYQRPLSTPMAPPQPPQPAPQHPDPQQPAPQPALVAAAPSATDEAMTWLAAAESEFVADGFFGTLSDSDTNSDEDESEPEVEVEQPAPAHALGSSHGHTALAGALSRLRKYRV